MTTFIFDLKGCNAGNLKAVEAALASLSPAIKCSIALVPVDNYILTVITDLTLDAVLAAIDGALGPSFSLELIHTVPSPGKRSKPRI